MSVRHALPAAPVVALLLFVAVATAGRNPQVRTSPKRGNVVLATSHGRIELELYWKKAPLTTANFARYVRSGFYDGTIFHRVIPRFMIQGGGYTKALVLKKARKPIPNEASNGLRNLRGTVAAARAARPNTATSQFFINLRDNPRLDHNPRRGRGSGWAVFGKVVKGMAVVDAIAKVRTGRRGRMHNAPLASVVITKAYFR